jgi:DNA-binding HxlR family transcriptional regulator
MPSWPELAKREEAARRRAIGQSPLDVSNPTGINAPKMGRLDIVRASWQQKIAAVQNRVIATLERPMTSADVARALGITPRAAHSRLTNMADKGLVIRRLVKSVAVWERKLEAAE